MMMTEKQMKQEQAKRLAAKRAAKRRRVMRNRMILFGIVVILVAAIVTGITLHSRNANAAVEEEIEYIPSHEGVFVEYYHDIKTGESLGTIAAKYIQQYGSSETVDDVVDRIINYNGLDRTEATYHLQAGQRIVVPIWIAEDRNPYSNTTEESQN